MKVPPPALARRCAAFGWRLVATEGELELTGNGAPARFRTAASCAAWLVRQERWSGRARGEQLELWEKAA